MDNQVTGKARQWTLPPFDTETRQMANELLNWGGDALMDAFYKDLDFGTGGMRGVMGVGTNRVNKYTIGLATQGLSNYLLKSFPGSTPSTAIAFDSRNNSQAFARIAAEVLSANGIKVYLFEALRPTPQLSFAIRYLNCQAGIVLTASHNPKEYNGYKVYWEDGGQLVSPHDKNVIDEVKALGGIGQVKFEANEQLIEIIGAEVDKAYKKSLLQLTTSQGIDKSVKIVYTPIHGTGIQIPGVLREAGYKNVEIVNPQAEPDGNFPTVEYPNPEEKAALDMALEHGKKIDADIVLGTDPDADRVGIAVKNENGEFELLNGNQAGAVLFYYVLQQEKNKGKDLSGAFVAKTIVTSDLISGIAGHFGVNLYQTLTGFKYIAELIRKKEGKETFICGGEESYGYLIGDAVRDKDGVAASLLLCEAAGWAKENGKTFFDLLLDIYQDIGMYRESLVSITKKGKKGLEEIAAMMDQFRNNPPGSIGGARVEAISDYQTGVHHELQGGRQYEIELPSSNVLQFHLSDGSIVTARPSGTEPKIKFYFSVKGKLETKNAFRKAWKNLGNKIRKLEQDLQAQT